MAAAECHFVPGSLNIARPNYTPSSAKSSSAWPSFFDYPELFLKVLNVPQCTLLVFWSILTSSVWKGCSCSLTTSKVAAFVKLVVLLTTVQSK